MLQNLEALKYLLVISFIIFSFSCSSGPPLSPSQKVLYKAKSHIHESKKNARTQVAPTGDFKVELRYNPSLCKSPDFEIFIYGGWMRVLVDAKPSLLAQAKKNKTRPLKTFALGQFATSLVGAPNRVFYPVFRVQQFEEKK